MSRRTRRAEQQQPWPPAAAAFAGTPKIVSNPIFYCEDGSNRLRPLELRCGGHGLDVVPAAAGVGKPLPLPPSRTRAGPAPVMSSSHSRVLIRRVPHDPFLAAYVACTKSGGKNTAQVKQQQKEKEEKKGGEAIRGCGIWNGWAASAKYVYGGGVTSCKYGSAVAVQEGALAAAAAAAEEKAPRGATLDLSWPPVVLPARERALARRRSQS